METDYLNLPLSLAVKLGSLAVYAGEYLSPSRSSYDLNAIETLVDDPEVNEWLDKFQPGLLPVKRDPREAKSDEQR